MKNSIKFAFCIIFALVFSVVVVKAQSSEWKRIQSDNGELSIEMPDNFTHIYDKKGFEISRDGGDNYKAEELHFLNTFFDKTLLTVESYNVKGSAVEGFYIDDKFAKKLSDFRLNNANFKQSVIKKDEYFCRTLYLNSKKNVYIITAASRDGETTAVKHFFDSIVFNANTKTMDSGIKTFTSFTTTNVNLIDATKSYLPNKIKNVPNQGASSDKKDENPGKILVVSKPRASYTDNARMKNVQGDIELKISFSKDGYIPKIEVLRTLPEGLFRQTLFSALRMKFLPEEIDAKPQDITKTVIYSFEIY